MSALLDGQLPAEQAEEAWAHVYACHLCRDQVEREGWVKSQLAGLSGAARAVPEELVGSLRDLTPLERAAPAGTGAGDYVPDPGHHHGRRAVAVVGGGAIGAAMVGILALGLTPGTSPAERRPPPANVGITQGPTRTTPSPESVAVTDAPASTPHPTGSSSPAGSTTPISEMLPVTVIDPR